MASCYEYRVAKGTVLGLVHPETSLFEGTFYAVIIGRAICCHFENI
jgi:hypothetical protein